MKLFLNLLGCFACFNACLGVIALGFWVSFGLLPTDKIVWYGPPVLMAALAYAVCGVLVFAELGLRRGKAVAEEMKVRGWL